MNHSQGHLIDQILVHRWLYRLVFFSSNKSIISFVYYFACTGFVQMIINHLWLRHHAHILLLFAFIGVYH